MNPLERRVRNLVNPFSTAFARWWCHTGRYLGPVRLATGRTAVRPSGRPRPTAAIRPTAPSETMAARRAAIDTWLTGQDAERGRPQGS
jgi:hypothetical protein